MLISFAIGWLNYSLLIDAYGSGPPYYGRTINMDKWSDPIPFLILVDIIFCIVFIAFLRFSKNKYNNDNSTQRQVR